MNDPQCVQFLQWALPRMQLRWLGFRRMRRMMCKRIARRMKALDLPDVQVYRAFLETHPSEWIELEVLCRVTISSTVSEIVSTKAAPWYLESMNKSPKIGSMVGGRGSINTPFIEKCHD